MFHLLFQTYVASILLGCFTYMLQEYVRNVSSVSVLCCNKCFHVASVLCRCCICFIHILQVYVLNVPSALDLCCIQAFHVASVSCFKDMFRESLGHSRAPREGPTNGAHCTPGVLQTGRARPHLSSWVLLARRERRGLGGAGRDGRERSTHAW
jgi:hypothetical protein